MRKKKYFPIYTHEGILASCILRWVRREDGMADVERGILRAIENPDTRELLGFQIIDRKKSGARGEDGDSAKSG